MSYNSFGTLDTSNLAWDLFFPVLLYHHVLFFFLFFFLLKMYGGCCRKRTNFQWRWEVVIALYLENILFKEKSLSPSGNCMWGHANVLMLEEQKDNI